MIDYTLDVRIVELCRLAEKKRRWNRAKQYLRRMKNRPALAAIAVCAVFDGALILSIILAWRRW